VGPRRVARASLALRSSWDLSSAARTLLVPLLAVPQLTHYVLDGFVWRRARTRRSRSSRATAELFTDCLLAILARLVLRSGGDHEDRKLLARTAISAGALLSITACALAERPRDRVPRRPLARRRRDRRRGGVGIDRGDVVADAAAAIGNGKSSRYGDATTAPPSEPAFRARVAGRRAGAIVPASPPGRRAAVDRLEPSRLDVVDHPTESIVVAAPNDRDAR